MSEIEEISDTCKNFIDITIPKSLTSDFLGSMVLDILHDAKGRGILKGRKLHEITDLISECFISEISDDQYNEQKTKKIRDWLFIQVFSYLHNMWKDNLDALFQEENSYIPVNYKNFNLEYYRKYVYVPIKPCGKDLDCFISLGNNRKGIECENFLFQFNRCKKTVSFESPTNVQDFFKRSRFFVDSIIADRLDSLVSLDMKSAAGLIRTTTDPIGYVSSIATFSDPGYNMAGMSAIRNYSKLNFTEKNNNSFSYLIKLETPIGTLPMFDVEYYWSESQTNDLRENVIIKVSDTYFQRSLPKAREMAEALDRYLDSGNNTTVWSSKEKMGEMIKDIRERNFIGNVYSEIYSKLHHGESVNAEMRKIFKKFPKINLQSVNRWINLGEDLSARTINTAYIISTLRLYRYYNIDTKYIFPEDVVINLFPEIIDRLNNVKLAYLSNHMDLIFQYANQPSEIMNPQQKNSILELLNNHRLGVRGKIVNLTEKLVKNLYKNFREFLYKKDIKNILKDIIQEKKRNIRIFEEILRYHLAFFAPEYLGGTKITDDILKMSLLDLCDRLNIYPDFNTHISESAAPDAINNILGKFSGDFGQILWCMLTGNIFASEDNNSSAIACILHRIPKRYIKGLNENGWVNIHGMGDGSAVTACIS